jgi:tetratricopeptide (TPR) repeat protein/predicted Ser/Thr protein kinase
MSADPALTAALADRYRIDRELGAGGMATVYLAQDLKHDRQVALKVIRADLSSAMIEERFTREIRLAAKLQHPHICSVYDSGRTEGGQLWYTMPFVAGESLRDRLVGEPKLPVAVAVRIAREAALALEYAHKQGVIHRDIKPENILLTEDGTTLVADFGIARMVDAPTGPSMSTPKLTQTGLAIGTPDYMSPEQRMGIGVDARSDVYSLAATLFEMLVGERPATGEVSFAQFMQPGGRASQMRIKRPDIPSVIEAIVRKGMAPDPDARYASMADFHAALEGTSAGQLRAAGGTRAGRRVAAIALTLLLAGAAVFFGWRRVQSATAPVTVAILPFSYPAEDLGLRAWADGLTEDLRNMLAALPSTRVTGTETTRRIAGGGRLTPQELGDSLDAQVLAAPRLERTGDSITVSFTVDVPGEKVRSVPVRFTATEQGLLDHRDSLVALLLTAAGRSPDPDRLKVAAAEGFRARVPAAYRRFADLRYRVYTAMGFMTQERYRSIGRQVDSVLAADPSFLEAIAFRAHLALQPSIQFRGTVSAQEVAQGLVEGRALLQRAQAIDPEAAPTLQTNALFLLASDDTAGAVAQLRRAWAVRPYAVRLTGDLCPLELARVTLTGPLPGSCVALMSLDSLNPRVMQIAGFHFVWANRLDDGIAAYRTCVRLTPAEPSCYWFLGDALQAQGKLEEAIAPLRQAIRLAPEEDFPHVVLGRVLLGLERMDEAAEVLRKAVSIPNHMAEAGQYLVDALVMANRPQEAIEAARKDVREYPNNPMAQMALGKAYFVAQQHEAALAAFRAAVSLNPEGLLEAETYAEANRTLGRVAEAQRTVDRIAMLPSSWPGDRSLVRQMTWMGQTAQALELVKQGWQRDTAEVKYLVTRSWLQMQLGQVDSAVASLDLAWRRDSLAADLLPYPMLVYTRAGRSIDALRAADKWRSFDPYNQAMMAQQIWTYARNGRRAQALAMLDSLEVRRRKVAYSEIPLLIAYAGVGDTARAAAALARSVTSRDYWLNEVIPEDSWWDILKGTPEYRVALRALRQQGDQ